MRMLPAGGLLKYGLRLGAASVAALVLVTAFHSDADARGRRHGGGHRGKVARVKAAPYDPPGATIVVDANSGQVMQQSNADSPRHPASLTKIMTLYMLFERLEKGQLKLTSELPVSAHAAAQAPSKLNLKPGETIRVDTAIRAIVTKSANDVAVTIGEALGGDEPGFGRLMTAKARALGMRNTTYVNASGLPDDRQITTARDQSILGRAIYDRFPQFYAYFSTRSFEYKGHAMRSHNHLLGQVPGLDGLKTGYIRASGFNIVTSVRRDGRHIVTAVFGGATAKARDARARALIESSIKTASTRHTAPPVVEGWDSKEPAREVPVASVTPMPVPPPAPVSAPTIAREVATAAPVRDMPVVPQRETVVASALPGPIAEQGPSVGSTDPIRPNAVKTFAVQPGAVTSATLSPLPNDNRRLGPAAKGAAVTTVATVKNDRTTDAALAPPPGARPGILGTLSSRVASNGANVQVPAVVTTEVSAKLRPGWMIQVGAFDDEKEARARLDTCQGKAGKELSKADPFTEKVSKGEKAMYRARFAGLEKEQAEQACKSLKRSDIPCMMLKN